MIKEWLPTQVTSIEVETGDSPSASIGNAGQVTTERVKTKNGQQAKLVNAPIMLDVLEVDTAEIARSNGSRWSDPEMRQWQSGGTGGVVLFSLGF